MFVGCGTRISRCASATSGLGRNFWPRGLSGWRGSAGRGSGFIFVSLTMAYLVARHFGFDSHNSVIDHGLFCNQTYGFDPHCYLRASSPGCGIDLEVHFCP